MPVSPVEVRVTCAELAFSKAALKSPASCAAETSVPAAGGDCRVLALAELELDALELSLAFGEMLPPQAERPARARTATEATAARRPGLTGRCRAERVMTGI